MAGGEHRDEGRRGGKADTDADPVHPTVGMNFARAIGTVARGEHLRASYPRELRRWRRKRCSAALRSAASLARRISRSRMIFDTAAWCCFARSSSTFWPSVLVSSHSAWALARASRSRSLFLMNSIHEIGGCVAAAEKALVPLAFHALAQRLAMAPHGLGLLSRAPLRGLFIGATILHLAERAFALHLFLQDAQRRVHIVVPHQNLHRLPSPFSGRSLERREPHRPRP